MMGSRFPSHQLSNGLYVSGWPEQPKERPPTMSSVAMLYTGGDLKKPGELGKLFDIPTDGSKAQKSGPITSDPIRTGSFGDLQAPGYISTGASLLRMEQCWRRSGGMKYQFRVEDLIGGQDGDFMAKQGSPIFKCPRRNEVVYGDVYMLDDENQWKVLPSMPKPDSRIEFAWALVNHSIIIAGGTTEKHPETKKMVLNGEVFQFNLDTLKWFIIGKLPLRVKTRRHWLDSGRVGFISRQGREAKDP